MTECTQSVFEFARQGRRQVEARFDGGTISSDGGAPLLREVDKRMKLLARFGACFLDGRNPAQVEHSVEAMVAQRVYGLALGYEDVNDHEQLRTDAVMQMLAEREPGEALAGKSTLNRLELGTGQPDRYKKITYWKDGVDELLVQVFLEAHATAPAEIILDMDTTDLALHGKQEGVFFTAITITTVICRCTFSAGSMCYARGCARPIGTPRRAAWRSYNAWSGRFARRGRQYASSSAGTRASAVTS